MFEFAGAAVRLVVAAFAIFVFSAAASAQYITYVASSGNDANNCLVQASPCKTLQRAVNVAAAKGTVRVLTPLTSSVFINKSITISGDDVPIVGQITIGGATAVVTLRGLALDGVGGFVNGIRIDSAAAVYIEDSTIERYTSDGISFNAGTATKLFISNTVSKANGSDGLHIQADSAIAEIENSRFEGNGNSGAYLDLASVNVTGSVASGNAASGIALRSLKAKIEETTANGNSSDGYLLYEGQATFVSVTASGNGTKGLFVMTGSFATISNCAFKYNSGADIIHDGQLVTFKNSIYGSRGGSGTVIQSDAF